MAELQNISSTAKSDKKILSIYMLMEKHDFCCHSLSPGPSLRQPAERGVTPTG
jgi:hypothetical protein